MHPCFFINAQFLFEGARCAPGCKNMLETSLRKRQSIQKIAFELIRIYGYSSLLDVGKAGATVAGHTCLATVGKVYRTNVTRG